MDRCDNRGNFHLRAAARLDYGTASRINAATLRAVIGCDRYAGPSGTIVGMHSSGASSKIGDVLANFGFVPDKIMRAAKNRIATNKIAKAKDDKE